MLSARALYSNTSESPEELSFNQGDVLTVLQKDINGLTGWWLCFIDGRVGLAPGNRLRTLSSHVEPDNETAADQSPSRQPINDDAQRIQTLKVSQRRNEIDRHDDQQIYDVPPSTLPRSTERPSQNPSDGSPDVIYDVPPPSSNTNAYDKPRRAGVVQEGEADYQVPRPMRTPSPVPHRSAQEAGNQTVTSDEANGPAAEVLLAANRGENLPGRTEDGKMGKVRVCVEDDEEASSEESVRGSTTGKVFRGGDVIKVIVSSEPDRGNPPGCDPGSRTTGKTDETFESVPRRLISPSCHDPRFGGNSTTLPRMSEIGGGRSPTGAAISPPSSSSSFGPCALQQLNIYDQGNRDSLLDDYSVPANWKTLPSPRYHRPTSDSFGRQQAIQTQPGGVPCDQPQQQSMRDAGKSRRSHSEVRSTGNSSSRLRGEPKSGGVGGGGSEYHLSFVDTGIYVDCPQDPESVSDMMESLRKTVRCQAARIRDLCLGFELTSGQRREADATQMKMCCLSLRTALKEFADLGTGALANAMQSPTRDLSENILQQLEMLRVLSQDLNCSVGAVIASFREAPVGGCVKLRDALNSLLTITQDIEQPLGSLSDLVAKNSTVIFSAGMALSPAAVHPAIMDIRSSSPTVSSGQVAALGSAREFRPLSPNVSPRASSSLASALEMRSGSPNSLYVQNPSQGNFVHGSVVRDSKTAAMISALPQAHESNYRSSSPMLTIPAALSPDFRTTSPHLPSSPVTSSLPIRKVVVTAAPEKPDATQYLQARPLPPVPPGEGKVPNSDWRSSPTGWSTSDASDWNSVESDYASIANEAERDMKSNVSVIVGRLTDRSNKDSHLLHPDEGPRTPGGGCGGGGGLSPQFRERMEALRPKTEQTMKLSCTGSRSDPSGSSSTEIAGFFTDFLTGIDREIVRFYVEEVGGHCDAVQLATDDFLRAVTDGLTTGSELVAVSRQVVLTAHKLLYAGDAITKKLVGDEELRSRVGSVANELCARLKRTVAASKADSDAGASLRRRQMIECMTQVKALSLGLKEMIFARVFDRMK